MEGLDYQMSVDDAFDLNGAYPQLRSDDEGDRQLSSFLLRADTRENGVDVSAAVILQLLPRYSNRLSREAERLRMSCFVPSTKDRGGAFVSHAYSTGIHRLPS